MKSEFQREDLYKNFRAWPCTHACLHLALFSQLTIFLDESPIVDIFTLVLIQTVEETHSVFQIIFLTKQLAKDILDRLWVEQWHFNCWIAKNSR